ncbi:P-loop NTPase fold protein [Paenimyroides ceti]
MSLNHIEKIKYESDQLKDFKSHIDLESNERILFSGPFGSGKSTFLNEFGETYEDEYKFVKLYPVNYSVSNNEDIFELIKHDILFELMSKHEELIDLQKEDFEFWLKAAMFMQNNLSIMPVLLSLISLHDKIGKPVSNLINTLEKVKIDYKEFSKSIEVDESKDILEFLNSFQQKKGGVYEMDATSQFIYDLVNRLKNSSNESKQNKTVLIIDDLDRLDPDHIFRLFNIFSAHTHSITGENKFGFDKVIFVCDVNNIKKIYHHKYGEGVDFSGYIDKFYSTSPFMFDLNKEIGESVSLILNDIEYFNINVKIKNSNRFKHSLSAIIKIFIYENLLNLRDLINLRKSQSIKIILQDERKMLSLTRIIFTLLVKLFGSRHELENKISILESKYTNVDLIDSSNLRYHNFSEYEYYSLLESLIIYEIFTNGYLETNRQDQTIFISPFTITYKVKYDDEYRMYFSEFIRLEKLANGISNIDTSYLRLPFFVLKNYEKMRKLNWI